jgi:hypothetical protein
LKETFKYLTSAGETVGIIVLVGLKTEITLKSKITQKSKITLRLEITQKSGTILMPMKETQTTTPFPTLISLNTFNNYLVGGIDKKEWASKKTNESHEALPIAIACLLNVDCTTAFPNARREIICDTISGICVFN